MARPPTGRTASWQNQAVADTAFLRFEVEPWIREQLAQRYGQSFNSQILALVSGGRHEFDAVSDDGRVVAAIKTSSGLTAGGRRPAGKINACLADLYYLSLIDAAVRLLILTNPDFFEIFTRSTDGALAPLLVENIEQVIERATLVADTDKVPGPPAAAIAHHAILPGSRSESNPP
jgi:hypothetical protein